MFTRKRGNEAAQPRPFAKSPGHQASSKVVTIPCLQAIAR